MRYMTKRTIVMALAGIVMAIIGTTAVAQMKNAAKAAIILGRGVEAASDIRTRPLPVPPLPHRFTKPKPIPPIDTTAIKIKIPQMSPALREYVEKKQREERKRKQRNLMINDYERLKAGKFAGDTLAAVRIAEMATKVAEDTVAVDCIIRFVETPPTIPQLAYALDSLMVENWRFRKPVAANGIVRNYITCVYNGIPECEPGEVMFERFLSDQKLLIELAEKYRRDMVPLAMIPSNSYLGDSLVAPLYYDAIRAMATYPTSYSAGFRQSLCETGTAVMLNGGMDSAMLSLFKEPRLDNITHKSMPLAWNLYVAAFKNADPKGEEYINRAIQLDPAKTDSMMTIFYNDIIESFLCNPDTNIVEFIVANAADPFLQASALCDTLIAIPQIDDGSFEKYTPEQLSIATPYMEAIISTVNLVDDSLANNYESDILRLYRLIAKGVLSEPSASNELQDFVKHCIGHDGEPGYTDLIPISVQVYAYVKADGLDKPIEGLNILKQHLKYAEKPGINPAICKDYYNYIAALYDRIGKKKQSEKFRKKSAEVK